MRFRPNSSRNPTNYTSILLVFSKMIDSSAHCTTQNLLPKGGPRLNDRGGNGRFTTHRRHAGRRGDFGYAGGMGNPGKRGGGHSKDAPNPRGIRLACEEIQQGWSSAERRRSLWNAERSEYRVKLFSAVDGAEVARYAPDPSEVHGSRLQPWWTRAS